MGIHNPISAGLERRRARRAAWSFNHALDAYARTVSRIERAAGVIAGSPSEPMPDRAARSLPRLRRDYAKFREACTELDDARDTVIAKLSHPKTPPAVAASARERFDVLAARHPTAETIAEREADWQRGIARAERWAPRDAQRPRAAADRRPAVQQH
jgi:hypothetical protein